MEPSRGGGLAGIGRGVMDGFAAVGRGVVDGLAAVGRASAFGATAARALGKAAMWGPQLSPQMLRVGVASVPIALFIATFTGIVMSLQASYTLTGTIPLYFVGVLVSKTMILELGPVLTGLTLAGRVGANISAELGTMRVTEQVDALETLAYDPVAYLVVPRVLAGTLMFPVAAVLAVTVGIASGWVAALQLLDMSSAEFVKGLRLFFEPWDVWFCVIKSVSFGFVVTSVGCFCGLGTRGGAEGVGRSATRSVVASSMIILFLDAVWAATLL